MINKKAIKAFLSRELRDYRYMKEWSAERVEVSKSKLPIRPPIWSKLRTLQKVCLLIGVRMKRFCFWLDTGSGKTLLSIALLRYFQNKGTVKRALILVPNKINKPEWEREIIKHAPDVPYIILNGSSKDKWELLRETDTLLIVATYMGLVHMVSDLGPALKTSKKENRLIPNQKLIKDLVSQIDALIMDESTAIQNHDSLPFRVCRQIAKHVPVVFALSATPFGRDPTSLWAQMYIIDWGETLGKNLGLFRAAFFKSKENYFSGFPEYTFDKSKKELLSNVIANRSIRYEIDQTDLPTVIPVLKEVRLPHDADTYYKKARDLLVSSHGNYTEQKNAWMRMRQISSGFLGYNDDETGRRAQIEFKPNIKLESLLSFIDEVVDDNKVVVFHEFVFSGSMICRELEKMGIKFSRVYGGTKDVDTELRNFVSKDQYRVMVVNSAAGAYGTNLQIAKYLCFYESPVSPLIRKQATRRVERQGSEHKKIVVADFVALDTLDQQILTYLEEGRDLFQAIIESKGNPL